MPECSSTSLAPWRSPLSRALHRNRSRAYSRYPQLATVRPSGRPANRTVVFRDFLPNTNSLLFITDIRSEKVEQIAHYSDGELCWYFTKTREQFRLGGQIQILTAQDKTSETTQIRQSVWEQLSAKSRQQFFWPRPGQPRVQSGYEPVDLSETSPLATFAVLVFVPDTVDHLELRGEPQNRFQYWQQPDLTWQVMAVNP